MSRPAKMNFDGLRAAGKGLWWLIGGHHGGLRELPDRLGYLAEGETALRQARDEISVLQSECQILKRGSLSLLERLTLANEGREVAEKARKDLGAEALRLRTQRDELQRRVDGQDSLLLAQLDVQRMRAEKAEADLSVRQEAEKRRQALLEAPAGTPMPILYPGKGKGQR